MGFINFLALIFILMGAINWGLIGVFKFNFIFEIFKETGHTGSILERVWYIVIGIFGLWGLTFLGKLRAICGKKKKD